MSANEPDLEALLGLSVELAQTMKEADIEAAKERHPSASGDAPGPALTAADRCDAACGAAALYRVSFGLNVLDYCAHHWAKYMPAMADRGWKVIGTNPSLLDEMYGKG